MTSTRLSLLFLFISISYVSSKVAWRATSDYGLGNFREPCDSSRHCNPAKNLDCSAPNPYTSSGVCECKKDYYGQPYTYVQSTGACQDPNYRNPDQHHQHYNPNTNQQVPTYYNNNGAGVGAGTKFVGMNCVADKFCEKELGELSRCNNLYKCECYDTMNFRDEVGEKDGTCWHARKEGEQCHHNNQCILGHPNLVCFSESQNYVSKICTCPIGKTCGNGNSANVISIFTSLTLTLVGLIATKIVL